MFTLREWKVGGWANLKIEFQNLPLRFRANHVSNWPTHVSVALRSFIEVKILTHVPIVYVFIPKALMRLFAVFLPQNSARGKPFAGSSG